MKDFNRVSGISFYHLKDYFLIGSSYSDQLLRDKFSTRQTEAIFKFINEGAFDGMFDDVTLSQYEAIVGLQYDSFVKLAGNSELARKLRDEEKQVKQMLISKSQSKEELSVAMSK